MQFSLALYISEYLIGRLAIISIFNIKIYFSTKGRDDFTVIPNNESNNYAKNGIIKRRNRYFVKAAECSARKI